MALAQILGNREQIDDGLGNPLNGGLVNVYEPNTTNRVTSYKASDIAVANANPVKLSGSGRANIWVTRNVDIRITDKDGNLVVEELSVNPDDLGGIFDSGLIPNGSFETDADADDVPDGWTEEVTSAGSNNGLDTNESTDGGQSLRTQSAGSGGGEFRTTAFFPVNDVDDLRVNFDLRSTVATVRNIVRVEWYDISQVSISNSDVYDSTANPATFTSKVLTATPPANSRFAKLRIMGGVTGGILAGITFWDRFQVFYPQVVSGVFDNLTISGNDIISTNTNGDINLTPNGTGDTVVKNLEALTLAQLGFGGEVTLDLAAANQIRLRADIVTATPPTTEAVNVEVRFADSDGSDILGRFGYFGSNTLDLRNVMHGGPVRILGEDAAGVLRLLFSGDPDADSILYRAGAQKLQTAAVGIVVRGSVLASTPPSTEASDTRLELFDSDGSDLLGFVGFNASNVLDLANRHHGGAVVLRGENAATGAARVFITCDADTGIEIRDPLENVIRLTIGNVGDVVGIRSDDSADDVSRLIEFQHQDGTPRARVGHDIADPTVLVFRNEIHGGAIHLIAETAGGASRLLFAGDPDVQSEMYHPVTNEIVIQSADAQAADKTSGAEVRHVDDTFYGIGLALVPRQTISGGNHTLAPADIGKLLFYDEGTNRSLLLNDDANIAVDTLFAYFVGPNASTLTGDGGTGVTITYWDGTAWVTTAAAANITIGEGQGTIYKNTDTNYIVNGPNLAP